MSVVNPQAPSYVGKDAVVYREKAKRLRWSKDEAGIEFRPFVVDGARPRARQGLSFAPLWSILLESLERGRRVFWMRLRSQRPIPDRDVTCSLERDLCSGLYGALSGGAGPCEQL